MELSCAGDISLDLPTHAHLFTSTVYVLITTMNALINSIINTPRKSIFLYALKRLNKANQGSQQGLELFSAQPGPIQFD